MRRAAGPGGAVWCIRYAISSPPGRVPGRNRVGLPSKCEGRVYSCLLPTSGRVCLQGGLCRHGEDASSTAGSGGAAHRSSFPFSFLHVCTDPEGFRRFRVFAHMHGPTPMVLRAYAHRLPTSALPFYTLPKLKVSNRVIDEMKRLFIGVGIGGVIFLGLIIGIVIIPVMEYSHPKWPHIADPVIFVRECKSIISTQTSGEVNKALWPESLKAISPLQVMNSQGRYLEIIISTGGIGPRFSYLVFASAGMEQGFSMPEVKLHQTEYTEIFKLY